MYFAIYACDEGLAIRIIEDMEEYLQECIECKVDFVSGETGTGHIEYLDENEVVLIKGEIVIPEKNQVVEKYKI